MEVAPVFHPLKSKYWVLTFDLLLPLIIIIFLICAVYLLLFSPVFQIHNLTCELDFEPCTEQTILVELNRLKGQNIFRFDTRSYGNRLTSAIFTIRQVEITKILPNTLQFQLLSVYPVVALKLPDSVDWMIFDDHLRLIRAVQKNPNVPTVIYSSPLTLKVGETPGDENLRHTLQLAREFSSKLPQITTMTLLDSTTFEITLSPQLRALLNPNEETNAQIESLRAILADDTIMGKVSVIDMRFSQPVLKSE